MTQHHPERPPHLPMSREPPHDAGRLAEGGCVSLEGELDAVRARSRAALGENERRVLDDAVERLRMMQIAEHALAPGDILPDFALPDAQGRTHTSEAYLARGPLVLGRGRHFGLGLLAADPK